MGLSGGLTWQQARRAFRVAAGRASARANARGGFQNLVKARAMRAAKRAVVREQLKVAEFVVYTPGCPRCGSRGEECGALEVVIPLVVNRRDGTVYCGHCNRQLNAGDWVFYHAQRHIDDERLRRPVESGDCISAADRAQTREIETRIRREDMRRELLNASYARLDAIRAESAARSRGDEHRRDMARTRREYAEAQLDAIRERIRSLR
jgi:hypothetical protein